MYSITTYIKVLEIQRTFLQNLFGGQRNDIYYLNPQLYKENVSIPVYNFGVFPMKMRHGEINSDDILEERVNEIVKKLLGDTVKIGSLWLEIEHIQFNVERDSE